MGQQQFKREHRYFVFKVKNITQEQQQRLYDFEMELGPRNSVGECVVVESDWPNYQETWDSIRDVSYGTFKPREVLVAELKAHHDQLLTELFNWRKKSASQAVQIETLAKEVDAANDRNAQLVEERDALMERIQTAERVEAMFNEAPELNFDDCVRAFPEQMRGVKAEAGRKGFVAGADALEVAQILGFDFDVEAAADEHAAKVRQGGAE